MSTPDGIATLEQMVERLTAENARAWTEIRRLEDAVYSLNCDVAHKTADLSRDAEIGAARAWVEMRSPGEPITATLEHALDALSRLPALESMVADEVRQNETFEARCAACGGNYEDERNKHLKRIAALESEQRDYERTCVRLNARLARVRETRAMLPTFTLFDDFVIALDAALAKLEDKP